MGESLDLKPKGIVKMLCKQPITPYCMSEGVDELLRDYSDQTTHKAAFYMFMLGYIEGKRAERARRKGKAALPNATFLKQTNATNAAKKGSKSNGFSER